LIAKSFVKAKSFQNLIHSVQNSTQQGYHDYVIAMKKKGQNHQKLPICQKRPNPSKSSDLPSARDHCLTPILFVARKVNV